MPRENLTKPCKKPAKPYPEFPLFAHQNGQWAKKIGNKMVYFGLWADWQGALKRYYVRDTPNTLQACIDQYVESRRRLQASGDLSNRHVCDIERTLKRLAAAIGPNKAVTGLKSEDFGRWRTEIAGTNGPVALGNHVVRVRAFLNWCKREKIISELPEWDCLKKPSRSVLRRDRATRGSRMFTAEEIRKLLFCAGPQMKAMILLALNAGLGNNDLALLKTTHIKGAWLDYPRPKTGIERRVPLWPETREALAAVIRPDDEAVFRTPSGRLWLPQAKVECDSPISAKFRDFCRGVGVYKRGRGFYSLRHVCQTIGEESQDHVATQYILGHAPPADDMSAVYRERMADKRLYRVVKYIRRWIGLNKPAQVAT